MKTNQSLISTPLVAVIAAALTGFNVLAADKKDDGKHHNESSNHNAPAHQSGGGGGQHEAPVHHNAPSHAIAHSGGGGGGAHHDAPVHREAPTHFIAHHESNGGAHHDAPVHREAPTHFIAHHESNGGAHHDAPVRHDAPSHFIAHNSGNGSHHDSPLQHAGLSPLHFDVAAGHGGSSHSAGPAHHSNYVTRSENHDALRSGSHASLGDLVSRDHHSGASHQGSDFLHSSDRGHHSDLGGRVDYSERHEHHSTGWYRDNGWNYDTEYWRFNHRQRYYNDDLGGVIYDNVGPDYYDEGYASPQSFVYAEPRRPIYRESTYNSETRAAVQDALAQAGYYQGEVDGVIGPVSQDAIASYQQDHGLRASGFINDALISALGLR